MHRRATGPCLLLAALTLAPPARADEWWGRDKALHLLVSAGLGGAAYGGLWLAGDDTAEVKLALAVPLALVPGLAKELYDDGQPGNRFSGRDMLWNAVGVLVTCGAMYLVERLWGRGRRHVGPKHTFTYWDRAPGSGTAVLRRALPN